MLWVPSRLGSGGHVEVRRVAAVGQEPRELTADDVGRSENERPECRDGGRSNLARNRDHSLAESAKPLCLFDQRMSTEVNGLRIRVSFFGARRETMDESERASVVVTGEAAHGQVPVPVEAIEEIEGKGISRKRRGKPVIQECWLSAKRVGLAPHTLKRAGRAPLTFKGADHARELILFAGDRAAQLKTLLIQPLIVAASANENLVLANDGGDIGDWLRRDVDLVVPPVCEPIRSPTLQGRGPVCSAGVHAMIINPVRLRMKDGYSISGKSLKPASGSWCGS